MWFCDPLVFHRQHQFWPSLQVTGARIRRSRQLLELEESYYHSISKNTRTKNKKIDIRFNSFNKSLTYFPFKHEHFTSYTCHSIKCRVAGFRYHVRSWSTRRFPRTMTRSNSCRRRYWRFSCSRNQDWRQRSPSVRFFWSYTTVLISLILFLQMRLTIQLLYTDCIIVGKLKVIFKNLVIWIHEWSLNGWMRQAQRMTKFVGGNRE